MSTTPSMDDLKEIAGLKTDVSRETKTTIVECDRVLTTKDVKKNGQYHITTMKFPGETVAVSEIIGKCPTCGELFIGKIKEDPKTFLDCINEDCETKFKFNDRKLVGCILEK